MPTLTEENRDLRLKISRLERALGRATFELFETFPEAGPAGKCPNVCATLTVSNPADAIDFYTEVLGGREVFRVKDENGQIAHTAIQIGDSMVFVSGEYPDMGRVSPEGAGRTSVALNLYVNDAKQAFESALQAGSEEVAAVEETFWGDVAGTITDPFGHQWRVATNVEELSANEIVRRAENEIGPQA